MARRLASLARHVSAGKIAGRLYNLGRFPGLKPARGVSDWVCGDVYDLGDDAEATLTEMDRYENAEAPPPTPYERELVTVTLDVGGTNSAWVYWYRGDVDEAQFIATGSFEDGCDPA